MLARSWQALSPALPASVVVLPFADMSPDGDQGYFADGMTEEIINALARLPDLRVVARTSAFAFKGKDADIRAIGEQLGVRNVVEGSVRRSGDRLRVTAQLVSVADGYHLWSETYERDVTDVFAIQEGIATRVAEALSRGRPPALSRGPASLGRLEFAGGEVELEGSGSASPKCDRAGSWGRERPPAVRAGPGHPWRPATTPSLDFHSTRFR